MELPKSITELQQGLLTKKYSARELTRVYLKRIERYNPKLNAFNTVCENVAFEQAKRVDGLVKELRRSELKRFPLLGTVVAHKDLFLTKGVRTTASSAVLGDYVPTYSGTAVKRLEEAGSIMIGKLNCDAWAHGASGENSDFGPTKNPWNLKYVPGGSSSGSAAAVAANLCTFATGTDTGGSVRQPASFCNLVGLKPTYGAISRYGVVAMASSLDTVGLLTRTVVDAEQVFEVLKGRDVYDSTVKNLKKRVQAKQDQTSDYKIGIPKEYFSEGIDKEVKKAVLHAVGVYKKMGVDFTEISLPHTKYAISAYYIIQPAEVASNLSRYDGVRYGRKRSYFGEEAVRRIMLGTYVLSAGYYEAYYLTAMKVRTKIIKDFDSVFDKVDAIIAPTSPNPAFKLEEKVKDPLEMYLSDILTVPANLAGIPSLAIPCGFSKSGLPIGFQLMGRRFSEQILFNLGKKYQEKSDWQERVPEPDY